MSFPLIKMSSEDRAMIWAIIDKYPSVRDLRYGINVKVFGISIRPSVSVKGIIKDIFGDRP